MEKRSKIYDKDGMIVERVEMPSKSAPRETMSSDTAESVKRSEKKIKRISVSDVIDALAGYLPPQANFMQTGSNGECVICGADTSNAMRKICFECMKHDGEKMCNAAKEAAENGDVDFIL